MQFVMKNIFLVVLPYELVADKNILFLRKLTEDSLNNEMHSFLGYEKR